MSGPRKTTIVGHLCDVHDKMLEVEAECSCWRKCVCELLDVTTYAEHLRGETHLVRGQSNGCPVHESEADRVQRLAREAAALELAARRDTAERAARIAP